MNYIISDEVEYDEDNRTLKCSGSGDIIQLTVTSSRLLSLLLHHQGDIVTREHILEAVWDAYDKTTSNNNLNQYVSILRRNLHLMGLDAEVITTVPRIGFMISNDLMIEKFIDKSSEKIAPLSSPKFKTSIVKKIFLPLSVVYIISMAFVSVFYWDYIRINIPENIQGDNMHMIYKVGECVFYKINDDPQISSSTITNFVSNVEPLLVEKCHKGMNADVFVGHDDAFHVSTRSRDIVTVCLKNNDGSRRYCRNTFIFHEMLTQQG